MKNIATEARKRNLALTFAPAFEYTIDSFSPAGNDHGSTQICREARARVGSHARHATRRSRSKMRTAIKRVRTAKEKEKAAAELQKTVKLLDQLAAKRVIHRNTAANNKSSLTRLVNAMK